MSEQRVQGQIIKWLESNGYWVVKTIQCNKNGVPDILACSPTGGFVAIEVKFGNGKPSKLQEYNLAKIKEKGGQAFLAWSLQEVKDYVDNYIK